MGEPVGTISDDEVSVNSADALCELLGITSLDAVPGNEDNDDSYDDEYGYPNCVLPYKCRSLEDLLRVDDNFIADAVAKHGLKEEYEETSVCIFPEEMSVPAEIMRRITDVLVCGGEKVEADRTFEAIKVWNWKMAPFSNDPLSLASKT